MMIKAIETEYKGYRFRSRLEARWAVFFDALGIKWEYEPEGFKLPDGSMYLPDFYLSNTKTWIEIKGASPTDAELEKCSQFEMALNPDARERGSATVAVLLGGQTTMSIVEGIQNVSSNRYDKVLTRKDAVDVLKLGLQETPKIVLLCGLFDETWVFTGKYKVKACEPLQIAWWLMTDDFHKLMKAAKAARSARFEFGEHGAPKQLRAA